MLTRRLRIRTVPIPGFRWKNDERVAAPRASTPFAKSRGPIAVRRRHERPCISWTRKHGSSRVPRFRGRDDRRPVSPLYITADTQRRNAHLRSYYRRKGSSIPCISRYDMPVSNLPTTGPSRLNVTGYTTTTPVGVPARASAKASHRVDRYRTPERDVEGTAREILRTRLIRTATAGRDHLQSCQRAPRDPTARALREVGDSTSGESRIVRVRKNSQRSTTSSARFCGSFRT